MYETKGDLINSVGITEYETDALAKTIAEGLVLNLGMGPSKWFSRKHCISQAKRIIELLEGIPE